MKCETCNKISSFRLAKEVRSYDAFDEAVEQLQLLASKDLVTQLNPDTLPRYFDCNNCGGTWEVRYPDPPIPGGMAYESPSNKRIKQLKTKYAK